ncbi:MAG: molybdopterin-guanine dinucleotide biosynthesis protein B [Sellimonas intestinalis]
MLYQNLTVRPVLFGVAGDKNTGKTTLMEELIRRLTNRGWKVAAIKHDGHDFEADREGTDSWRHYHAGAYGTVGFRTGNTSSSRKKRIFPGEAHSPFSGSGCDSDRGNETGVP